MSCWRLQEWNAFLSLPLLQTAPSPSESAWFTYTRLSSKSDIQDQSGHPREPQPVERLSEPPFATLIFKPLLHCQLTSPSNRTGRLKTELFPPWRFSPLHQLTLWGTIHRHPPCARQLQTLAKWIAFPDWFFFSKLAFNFATRRLVWMLVQFVIGINAFSTTCEAEITLELIYAWEIMHLTCLLGSVEAFLWSVSPINKMLTFSNGIYLRGQRAVKIDIEVSTRWATSANPFVFFADQ